MAKDNWNDALKPHPSDEDYLVTALIDNAGHVGTMPKERIEWSVAVETIQRVVNLHADNILREGEMSREAHDKAQNIRANWARILQG